MLDHPHGLIFVHVPKCAGMSVELALGGLPPSQRAEQHLTGDQLRRYYPEAWESYHRFAVVRHPLDRCWSFVRFYRRFDPVWRRHLGALDDELLLRELLFSRNMLTRFSAHRMLTGEEELLRFEALDVVWPEFARRHGLPEALPHKNRAPRAAPSPSTFMAYLVAAHFPEDYDRFGYTRPDPAEAELTLAERGTLCWAELHAWAMRLPDRWSTDAARAAEAWLRGWRERLPDPGWVAGLDRLLDARPPCFTGAPAMQLWAEELHDDVNRELGRPLWAPWSA